MSNTAVGNVYQAIIDEVVNSRVDFEESGIEESVLEELRQVR
jgi:transcription initiation factor TFIIA large subunit